MPTTTTTPTVEKKGRSDARPLGGSIISVKGRPGVYGQAYRDGKRRQALLINADELADLKSKKKNVQKVAEARLAAFVVGVANAPTEEPAADAGPTVGKLVTDYLRVLETRTVERHARTVKAQLERFRDAKGIGADTPAADIARSTVESYVAALSRENGAAYVVKAKDADGEEVRETKHKPMSPATVRRHVAALSGLFNFARDRGVVTDNPVRGVKLARPQEFAVRLLTADEIANVLRHARPQVRDALTFLSETGCRYSEMSDLQWPAVDAGFARVTIARSKSGRVRHVTLTAAARRVIEGLHDTHTRPIEGPNYVFARLSHPRFFKLFKRAVAKAGLPASTRIHDLRHSLASRMVMRGVPVSVVAEAIGDTLQVAMRYAKHTPADAVAAAFRAMESASAPTTKTKKPKVKQAS